MISGIFFLYTFLVRDAGNTAPFVHFVQTDFSSGLLDRSIAVLGIFFLYNFLVRPSGKQVLSVQLPGFIERRPGPHPSGTRGLVGSPRKRPSLEPVITSRLMIGRDRDGHRTGQVPERWESERYRNVPGYQRLYFILCRDDNREERNYSWNDIPRNILDNLFVPAERIIFKFPVCFVQNIPGNTRYFFTGNTIDSPSRDCELEDIETQCMEGHLILIDKFQGMVARDLFNRPCPDEHVEKVRHLAKNRGLPESIPFLRM